MDFDLTTADGRKQAKNHFNKYDWIYFTGPWLLKKALDSLFSNELIEEQRNTAISLIKAGRDNNVDEMKITLDQKAGLHIEAELEEIPIKAKIGKSGHMILEVKYKNAQH